MKESSDDNIETDITLTHNNIPIENKGTGLQCFIKTEMSLKRAINDIDSVLIEEPETHLSYMNMLKLIDMIKETENRQLFISTHSDLICTRLNLQKCILFNSTSQTFAQLSALTTETAEFFMKAPDNNMLQFVLSKESYSGRGRCRVYTNGSFIQKHFTKGNDRQWYWCDSC